ncbi:hypothetical protein [Neorhodopirellula pilleata]|uniref:Uncharacterized protein n=1 Tax=Neorhodopirellula pilleata TaxID=2714738 RepID=A0A5C6A906_9BACT|nr:hypothetical protein [Neorhodopirellula pilleata]TWT96454.1 hypothetical protein Pla100_29340 [Neorhodopirellula pilleata]
MLPTVQDIEPRIRKASDHPDLITEDDLWILSGALLLCLREDDNGVSREYARLAEGRDLQQDVAESLANLTIRNRNPTLEPLLVTFERDQQFYEAMHAALAMTFPRTNGEPIKRNTVTQMQMEVLKRLAAAETIWTSDMTLRDRLIEHGLPSTRHELNRMVVPLG